jgi:hypothetical protein
MEPKTIQLIMAASTCISGLILLYFAVTHLRYLKDAITRMIEHIKNLISASEKEQQIKQETNQALKKIDEKVEKTIRDIDDSFDERYKKFSEQIDNYQVKTETPQQPPTPEVPPAPTPQPSEPSADPIPEITIGELPKPIIYLGPIAIGLGLLFYFLTKGRKK